MAARFTQEQLDKLDKETIIRLFLGLQEQSEELTREVHDLNEKMQLMLEQLVLSKKNRFGRSTEKMEDTSQIRFMEVTKTPSLL